MLSLATVKSDPVKNVPITTPTSSVPSRPLMKRKMSYVFVPNTLPGRERNSYETACSTNDRRMSIQSQYAPPKLVE